MGLSGAIIPDGTVLADDCIADDVLYAGVYPL